MYIFFYLAGLFTSDNNSIGNKSDKKKDGGAITLQPSKRRTRGKKVPLPKCSVV
jgi:hypothetical protein